MLSIPFNFFLIIGLLMITFGQSVLRVVMNGQLISKSSPDRRGEILGISASIISLAAGISPFVAGALFNWKVYAPFLMGSFFLLCAFFVLFKVRQGLEFNLSPKDPIISEV